jgi:large subunit ribosomal protein L25
MVEESGNPAMSKFIQLSNRTSDTKSNLNVARKQGRIPAVLYGIGKDTLSLEVNEKELLEMLRTNPRAILQGKLSDGTTVPVVVQNIQKQSMSGKVLHIDFQHVNMNISMDSKVTIHFAGDAAGVKEGGVLQVEIYEVEVRCMPGDLPTSMEVDISDLAIGDQLLVSDLIFQDGIEVLTDPSTVMIQIKTVHEEVEEPAEPAATPA